MDWDYGEIAKILLAVCAVVLSGFLLAFLGGYLAIRILLETFTSYAR